MAPFFLVTNFSYFNFILFFCFPLFSRIFSPLLFVFLFFILFVFAHIYLLLNFSHCLFFLVPLLFFNAHFFCSFFFVVFFFWPLLYFFFFKNLNKLLVRVKTLAPETIHANFNDPFFLIISSWRMRKGKRFFFFLNNTKEASKRSNDPSFDNLNNY